MVLIVISSIVLIVNVLLQEDKTGGLSGSFGGGSENVWAKNKGKGFDALSDKLIILTAIIILVSSIALAAIQQ
jgi:preprotein translocase subunit SecG